MVSYALVWYFSKKTQDHFWKLIKVYSENRITAFSRTAFFCFYEPFQHIPTPFRCTIPVSRTADLSWQFEELFDYFCDGIILSNRRRYCKFQCGSNSEAEDLKDCSILLTKTLLDEWSQKPYYTLLSGMQPTVRYSSFFNGAWCFPVRIIRLLQLYRRN